MNTTVTQYNGIDLLENLEMIENYNNYIINRIMHWMPKNTKDILDFGAGRGTYADLLKKKGVCPLTFEIDLSLVKILENKNYKNYNSLNLIQDKSIEFIYTLNVLEHIEDDATVINELFRILKPGGMLYIYVPALPFLYTSMDKKVGHFRRYTKKSISPLLKDFKILNIEYVDFLGVMATLAYKLLGNNKGDVSSSSLKIYDKYLFPISKMFDYFTRFLIGKNLQIVCKKDN